MNAAKLPNEINKSKDDYSDTKNAKSEIEIEFIKYGSKYE